MKVPRNGTRSEATGASSQSAPAPQFQQLDLFKNARATISIPGMVMAFAGDLMLAKGFGHNLSNYVADLIRHDRDNHIKYCKDKACLICAKHKVHKEPNETME